MAIDASEQMSDLSNAFECAASAFRSFDLAIPERRGATDKMRACMHSYRDTFGGVAVYRCSRYDGNPMCILYDRDRCTPEDHARLHHEMLRMG